MSKVIKQQGGLKTAAFEPADASAIQAVFDGRADEIQQKRAMRWILDGPCRIHEVSFDPGNARVSDFNEGCRFVGKQIAEVLRTSVPDLIERLRRTHETAK